MQLEVNKNRLSAAKNILKSLQVACLLLKHFLPIKEKKTGILLHPILIKEEKDSGHQNEAKEESKETEKS